MTWKLYLSTLLLLFITVQCLSPTESPTPRPVVTPSPTPIIPPEMGDGSDLIDQILARGFLRVGLRVSPTAAFAPAAFRGASNAATGGALTGFEVDIAYLLAHRLGLELELIELPPTALLAGEWAGQADVALGLLTPFDQPDPTTGPPLQFSRPYGYLPLGLLVAAEETDIAGLNDLAGRRVAVLEQSAYQRILTEQPLTVYGQPLALPVPATTEVVPVSSLWQATEQLSPTTEIETTLAAIFGPTPQLRLTINEGWPVKFASQAEQIGFQPLSLATRPQDGLSVDRLLTEINRVLVEADQQGDLSEIYYRWYDDDFSRLP